VLIEVENSANLCSWATSVRKLQSLGFTMLGCSKVLETKRLLLKLLNKDLMTCLYISGLLIIMTNSLETSNRVKTYLLYAHFRLQPYLINGNLYKFRSALTSLRISAHRLEVETGRWHKPRAIPYPDRKCIACNKLEDEFQFMLECPLYKDIRKIYNY